MTSQLGLDCRSQPSFRFGSVVKPGFSVPLAMPTVTTIHGSFLQSFTLPLKQSNLPTDQFGYIGGGRIANRFLSGINPQNDILFVAR
jgi:hypothetical protein